METVVLQFVVVFAPNPLVAYPILADEGIVW
jgi:hypothetical protein